MVDANGPGRFRREARDSLTVEGDEEGEVKLVGGTRAGVREDTRESELSIQKQARNPDKVGRGDGYRKGDGDVLQLKDRDPKERRRRAGGRS
jgi:hypothetical protein